MSQIAGPRMALDTAQARLMREMMRDPTALGGLWLENREPVKEGEGAGMLRQEEGGTTIYSQKYTYGSDGFTSVMTATVNKASVVRDFGDEGR